MGILAPLTGRAEEPEGRRRSRSSAGDLRRGGKVLTALLDEEGAQETDIRGSSVKSLSTAPGTMEVSPDAAFRGWPRTADGV